MKLGTGKPKRKRKEPKKAEILPAFDVNQRHTIKQTSGYLKNSVPTVYKLIAEGRLETFHEGRRRYVTGRSIARLSLPPTPTDRAPSAAPQQAATVAG
jgi:hypothetical protein